MADPPLHPEKDAAGDTPAASGHGSKPPMPRWVKVFVIIAIVFAVVLIIGLLTGHLGPGGRHGPGRHFGGAPGHYEAGMRGQITIT
jgi:hypothetical protein